MFTQQTRRGGPSVSLLQFFCMVFLPVAVASARDMQLG